MNNKPSRVQHDDYYKKALSNLLKRKDYHIASPTKKHEMLIKEYTRILRSEE